MSETPFDDPRLWMLDTYRVPPGSLEGRAVALGGGEGHHAVTVARVRRGDLVRLIDGEGVEAIARVERVRKSRAFLTVVDVREHDRSEGACLTLVQSLPKRRAMDNLVRRAAELGVAEIVPVVTKRTVLRRRGGFDAGRLERWRAIALAATKQSRGVFVTKLRPLSKLDDVGGLLAGADLALVAWEEERDVSLREAVSQAGNPSGVVVVVGPEGGLTREEVLRLVALGARPVSLGRRILRADWAGAAVCAMVAYELGGLMP